MEGGGERRGGERGGERENEEPSVAENHRQARSTRHHWLCLEFSGARSTGPGRAMRARDPPARDRRAPEIVKRPQDAPTTRGGTGRPGYSTPGTRGRTHVAITDVPATKTIRAHTSRHNIRYVAKYAVARAPNQTYTERELRRARWTQRSRRKPGRSYAWRTSWWSMVMT